MKRTVFIAKLTLSALLATGCGADHADQPESSSGSLGLDHALSITLRPDGRYDVRCRDGSSEVRTQAEVSVGRICEPVAPPPPPPPADPFSESYCAQPPMTEAQALDRIPLPRDSSASIGVYEVRARYKICWSADGCTAWNNPPSGTNISGDQFASLGQVWVAATSLRDHRMPIERGVLGVRLSGNRPTLTYAYASEERFTREYRSEVYAVVRGTSAYSHSWLGYTGTFGLLDLPKRTLPTRDYFDGMLDVRRTSDYFQSATWSGVIADQCMRLKTTNVFPIDLGSGNTGTVFQEAVVFGQWP